MMLGPSLDDGGSISKVADVAVSTIVVAWYKRYKWLLLLNYWIGNYAIWCYVSFFCIFGENNISRYTYEINIWLLSVVMKYNVF